MSDHDSSREWQDKILTIVTETSTELKGFKSEFLKYTKENDDRVYKLTRIVVGNGEPGLAEKVRSVTWKIATFAAVVTWVVGLVIVIGIQKYTGVSVIEPSVPASAASSK